MSARLSVNINKVALIRNARGSNLPDLVRVALDCERFGAQGITVHPRPDERHVRYGDIPLLKRAVTEEFNIEGNPNPRFLQLVLANGPDQCTLVPDAPDALTSDTGWDTFTKRDFLTDVIAELKSAGIRTSIFLDPDPNMVEGAMRVGADRIELYTGEYAKRYHTDRNKAIEAFVETAEAADAAGLGINAGHDLNLENLAFFQQKIPHLLEVSIGHAIIADALYYGLHNTIQMYLQKLS
ncbi:MAG: pyridoxine 5'-phosphate synthase [Saprospiraceae bacterium]|nr:pyridoxine 5'-phosphate synthase [Saprospiraceae bacterium]